MGTCGTKKKKCGKGKKKGGTSKLDFIVFNGGSSLLKNNGLRCKKGRSRDYVASVGNVLPSMLVTRLIYLIYHLITLMGVRYSSG